MGIFRRRRNTEPSEAHRARMEAERSLAETRAETPLYKALGDSLRQLRTDNHFADHIANSFREGRQ